MEAIYFLKGMRVGIRHLRPEDLSELLQLEQDPVVMTYINGGYPLPSEEVEERLSRAINFYNDFPGLGKFAVCMLDDDRFLGWACLQPLDNTEEIELGYRLHQHTWGKGIATEASKLLCNYYFHTLMRERLVAITRHDNFASRKVIEKTGLHYEKEATFYNTEVLYYSLDKE